MLKPQRINLRARASGEIEAVGKDVKRFKKGDPVFALTDFCGGYAQYKCLHASEEPKKEIELAIKPTNMTFEEAAAVPVRGITALVFLRKANIKKGQRARFS